MTSQVRPNFFLLLELKPDDTWDHEQYERKLREKIKQWNRDSLGVAKKALLANRNRAFIPQIHQVMDDPIQRQQEALEAKKELLALAQGRQTQFEKQLAFINIKNVVNQNEIDKFIEEFVDIFSAEDIKKRITARIVQNDKDDSNEAVSIDDSILNNIRTRLEILNLGTLYELLQQHSDSATVDLFHESQRLYQEVVRLPPTAEITAKMELAGLALDVFKSEQTRVAYDEDLRRALLFQLLKELDDSMSRTADKEVHPNQILLYLDTAFHQGWSKEEALKRLKEHARQRKWIMTLPVFAPEPQQSALASPVESSIVDHRNIQKLEYQTTSSSIRLRWMWPEHCTVVYLSYSSQAVPSSHQQVPESNTLVISRAMYDRLGYFDLEGTRNALYHILLSAMLQLDDQQQLLPGLRLTVRLRKISLSYEFKPRTVLRQNIVLHIVSDEIVLYPTLLVMYKKNDIPFRKEENTLLYRIVLQEEKKDVYVHLPDLPLSSGVYGKLFLEDDSFYQEFVIHHPHKNRLRLT